MRITVLGLGSSDLSQLSYQVMKTIEEAEIIYARTVEHPVFREMDVSKFVFFDKVYEQSESFDEVYEHISSFLLKKAATEEVFYAVPGSPYMAEKTVEHLLKKHEEVEILPGTSFLESTCNALALDPVKGLQIVDGLDEFTLNPRMDSLIVQIYSQEIASQIKLKLMKYFSDEHVVTLVYHAGAKDQDCIQVPLYQMDRIQKIDHLSTLYVPKAMQSYTFHDLEAFLQEIRSEKGCAWDKAQTKQSLKKYLYEEVLEVIGAIEQEDDFALEEELGDLLFEIMFLTQIAKEEGSFTIDNILETLLKKMRKRYADLFSETKNLSYTEIEARWKKNKQKEKNVSTRLNELMDTDPLLMLSKLDHLLHQKQPNWSDVLTQEEKILLKLVQENPSLSVELVEKINKLIVLNQEE